MKRTASTVDEGANVQVRVRSLVRRPAGSLRQSRRRCRAGGILAGVSAPFGESAFGESSIEIGLGHFAIVGAVSVLGVVQIRAAVVPIDVRLAFVEPGVQKL